LPERAGGAFKGADVAFLQVLADAVPGVAGGGLDDPDRSRASQQRMMQARMRSSSRW
jgi:hypothetical protein